MDGRVLFATKGLIPGHWDRAKTGFGSGPLKQGHIGQIIIIIKASKETLIAVK